MFPVETRILIAEDSRTIRAAIRENLSAMGYTWIHEAEDGEDAMRIIKSQQEKGRPIQLICCDWNMPNLSGIEFLAQLKELPFAANIPFLMITGEKQLKQVNEAIALGVTGYIVKPFSFASLKEKLGHVWVRAQKKEPTKP